MIALLTAVHQKLGAVQSSERVNWGINSFNLQTNVTLVYKTRFTHGEADETFVFRMDSGQAKLVGYNINSLALITK